MKAKKAKHEILRRAVAHLDEVTLDRVWQAALRGDMDIVERILAEHVSGLADIAGSDRPATWRDSSSWLFGRSSFDRKAQ